MSGMEIAVGDKRGDGVGACLKILNKKTEERIGALTFHEGGDWQVTDSSRAGEFSWDLFEAALKLAREQYPQG